MSLDKSLEVNHISARVGDNVEIKCDVTGTPPPPLVWRRNKADLETLNEPEVRSIDTKLPLKMTMIYSDVNSHHKYQHRLSSFTDSRVQ